MIAARFRPVIRQLAVPVTLMVATGFIQANVADHLVRGEHPAAIERYWGEYINTRMARRFLGLSVSIANLIWIDLLYKSDQRHDSGYSPLYKAAKAILELDPKNYMSVWFSGLYLSVIKDDIPGASRIFREAVTALERDTWVTPNLRGSIYFAYGYHLMYEEHDMAQAAKYIILSSEQPGATHLSKSMAETLSTERGQIEVGFRVLNEFYRRVKTDEERKRIEAKMTALLVKKELMELNEQFDSFRMQKATLGMPRTKAYQLFLRAINHRGRDSVGHKLIIGEHGRIQQEGSPK